MPGNRTASFVYDARGNLTSITPPGQPQHRFTYTPIDLQASYVPPDVGAGTNQTGDTYNNDRQLTQVSLPTGQAINLGYDSFGRLNAITIPRGMTSFSYDNAGRSSGVAAPGGQSLAHTFDGGLLASDTWSGPAAGSASQTYDSDFRTTGRSVNGATTIGFTYDPDSLTSSAGAEALTYMPRNSLPSTTTLGVVADSRTYNGFGEPTDYTATTSGSAVYRDQLVRDGLGRIISKTETISGVASTTAYEYDTAGRLSTVTTGAGTTTYVYDANGNRLSASGPSGTFNGTYDAQDRLLTYGTNTYAYTADGQLRTRTDTNGGQTTTYQYDELGNLVGATLPDGTQIGYQIDGQNRRVGKTVNGVAVQHFLYQDGLRLIAELDGTNNVVSRFVYTKNHGAPDYVIKGGATYRIIADTVGSPRLVVHTGTGAVAQQLDFDEFGNVLNDSNPGFLPLGFAGGLYDQATRLTRFGARDYSAEIGRWIAKDPLGFAGGDTNLYSYVADDPVNLSDATGTFWVIVAYGFVLFEAAVYWAFFLNPPPDFACRDCPAPQPKPQPEPQPAPDPSKLPKPPPLPPLPGPDEQGPKLPAACP